MAATQLGTVQTLIPGAQILVDRTSVTYTLPKTMKSVNALDPTQHPRIGTVAVILGNYVALESISIARDEGDMATVSYTYKGTSVESASASTQPPDSLVNFTRKGDTPPRFEMDATAEAISILRHPHFADLTRADRTVLTAMIQNGPIDSDGNQLSRFLSSSTLAAEASNMISGGTTSYLAPSLIWKEISFNQKWSSVPAQPGFVFDPPGPVPTIDGNWILIAASASGFEDMAESVTRVYQSSIHGDVWNETLYNT